MNSVTVQFHNQVLLPISHLASILTSSRRLSSTPRTAKHHELNNKNDESSTISRNGTDLSNAICIDSLLQAAKSLTSLFKSGMLDSRALLTACQYVERLLAIEKKPPLPWMVSHTSRWTFDDNKRAVNIDPLGCKGTRHPLLSKWSYIQRDALRGFKTRTSTSVGLGQDSKSNTGIAFAKISRDPRGEREGHLKSIKNKLFYDSHSHQQDRFRSLVNDEGLPPEEQHRIRVAFAEGYAAADPKVKTTTSMKVISYAKDILWIVLILAILVSFMGDLTGGPVRKVLLGRTNEVHPEEIDVTFDDVRGCEEAKQELEEVVEYLKNPEKFSRLGGKLPKGVLLVGPPGTGKTLLARAVAGEAKVPFFHAAGPEFDEVLVGQGARRVRDLFSAAKIRSPCVIFIDEIDSVGAKRTNSVLHPYANQTINQLLTEMDGFRQNEGVIVLGATNRRDDLDRALLRPGRFDIEVSVPVPDLKGRKEILELYLGKVTISRHVDVGVLARGTTGFTGADIENMVNQAALRAAIDGGEAVTMKDLEAARDKVIMGPERKSRIPDEEANRITAYHEGGHTLVSHFTKDAHPIHKVTIVPRGQSLGHTASIPEKEWYHITKSQMLALLDTLMGGRAAEELIFGPDRITSGAADDLKKATVIATQMVKDLGMSERVGVRTFDENHSALVVVNDLSASTSEAIDAEIKRILQESYERAKAILKNHAKEHKAIAEALLKYETLDAEEVKAIIEGKEIRQDRHSATNPLLKSLANHLKL